MYDICNCKITFLLFQAFLEDPNKPGKFTEALDPVCSTNIFDAKARKELQIMDISDVTAPPEGGKKILLFCEKVSREDIKVGFTFSGQDKIVESIYFR